MSHSPEPTRPIAIDSRWKRQLETSSGRSSSDAKQRELTGIGAILDGLARPGIVLEEILCIIAEELAVTIDADGVAIVLLEEGEFVCRATYGQAAPLGSRVDISSGLSGECIRMGSGVRCDDAELDPRVNAEACRSLNVRSVAAVPLLCGGEILGLVEVFSSRVHAFSDEDLATLRRMASAVVAAVNQSAKSVEPSFHAADPVPCLNSSEDEIETSRDSSWRSTALRVLIMFVVIVGAFSGARPGFDENKGSHAGPAIPGRPRVPGVVSIQLRNAANAGDANSEFMIGSLYIQGESVPQDYAEAVKWFSLAAQQGHVPAQSMLGALYLVGRGVPQDYVSAYTWTKLAAEGGNDISKERLPQLSALLPPKLIKPILDGKADVVYGSRLIGGETHRVLYFWHSVGNKLLTLLSNMFTDLNLSDVETGYKVFRREIIQSVRLTENRFGFEPEITARIAALKCRVYEVGISYSGRTYEEGKKIGWKDGLQTLWCILKHNLWDQQLLPQELAGETAGQQLGTAARRRVSGPVQVFRSARQRALKR
jgi:putative methionine-R-sulfoxide reductase with GAF domain